MKIIPSFVALLAVSLSLTSVFADHHGELRAAIEEAEKKWVQAWNARDIEALLKLYSEDATVLVPNKGVVTGKAALRKTFQEEFEETKGLVQELEILDVKGQGDLATEIGKWVMKSENSQEVVDRGTFMVLWKKEDGEWKTLWETWNSSLPAKE